MKEPRLYIMVGLSASGKSTIADELAEKKDGIIVSSDDIRLELFNDVSEQSKNDEVFREFNKRIKDNLLEGKTVIADATNIRIRSRRSILNYIKGIKCYKIAYLTTETIEDCIKNDTNRTRHVAEDVIMHQVNGYQIPFKEEGFDEIIIHNNKNPQNKYFHSHLQYLMCNFDQKNPHHSQTLINHCKNAVKLFYIKERPEKEYNSYFYGLCFHDLGKLFTQTFDDNGVAHYYNHDNVGTYYLLSHYNELKSSLNLDLSWKDKVTDEMILNSCFVLNYHMYPYSWDKEEIRDKYKKVFGEFKYNLLSEFHECDKSRINAI